MVLVNTKLFKVFFSKHEAKALPVSLIKKKVARLITENRAKTDTNRAKPHASHGQANPIRHTTRPHTTTIHTDEPTVDGEKKPRLL